MQLLLLIGPPIFKPLFKTINHCKWIENNTGPPDSNFYDELNEGEQDFIYFSEKPNFFNLEVFLVFLVFLLLDLKLLVDLLVDLGADGFIKLLHGDSGENGVMFCLVYDI